MGRIHQHKDKCHGEARRGAGRGRFGPNFAADMGGELGHGFGHGRRGRGPDSSPCLRYGAGVWHAMCVVRRERSPPMEAVIPIGDLQPIYSVAEVERAS